MTTLNTQVLADSPMAPESVDALDVPRSLLEELLLKILYFAGPLSVPEWGDLARLKPLVVEELFRRSSIRLKPDCKNWSGVVRQMRTP